MFQQSLDTVEILKELPLANICPFYKKVDRALLPKSIGNIPYGHVRKCVNLSPFYLTISI